MIDTNTYVPPSAPWAPTGERQAAIPNNPLGTMGKNEFLKLLVAQMQNQDPENPMKGDEMAAQLAQFSSVEQLLNINETLSSQTAATGAMNEAVSYNTAAAAIGRTVTAVGNQVAITNGEPAQVSVTVGTGGGKGTLHLYNSAGVEVATRDMGDLTAGDHTFDLGNAQSGLSSGAYTYKVDVTSKAGTAVDVVEYTTGKIDRVEYSPTGPVLGAGVLSIAFGAVVRIAQ